MLRKMDDDEAMDYAYKKLFGDLDNIHSKALFPGEEEKPEGIPHAEMAGIEISIRPVTAPPEAEEAEESEEEDKLKGISDMSPLMAQLHGGK